MHRAAPPLPPPRCLRRRSLAAALAAPSRLSPPSLSVTQEEYDLNQSIDSGKSKLIDAEGAGRSMFSPGWLTQLNQLWGGKSVRLPALPGGRQLCHTVVQTRR